MFLNKGISNNNEANNHAPGSPAHVAIYAHLDAEALISPPFIIIGKNAHIHERAINSAMPAPKTYPALQTP